MLPWNPLVLCANLPSSASFPLPAPLFMARSQMHPPFALSQHLPRSLPAPFFVPQPCHAVWEPSPPHTHLSHLSLPFSNFSVTPLKIQALTLGCSPHILLSFPCPLLSTSSSTSSSATSMSAFHQQAVCFPSVVPNFTTPFREWQ